MNEELRGIRTIVTFVYIVFTCHESWVFNTISCHWTVMYVTLTNIAIVFLTFLRQNWPGFVNGWHMPSALGSILAQHSPKSQIESSSHHVLLTHLLRKPSHLSCRAHSASLVQKPFGRGTHFQRRQNFALEQSAFVWHSKRRHNDT